MRREIALLLVGVCRLSAQGDPARAGDEAPPYSAPVIIVATVTKVSDEAATNGNPPRVGLKVNQVLRGNVKDNIRGLWNPRFHGFDTGGFDAELKAWQAKPLTKPKVGQKFILSGWMVDHDDGPILSLSGYGKVPLTPAALAAARREIELHDAM
jgi:hypothetical protein